MGMPGTEGPGRREAPGPEDGNFARVPGTGPGAGHGEAEHEEFREQEGRLPADAFEVQRVDVVVHEVGEHRGPDAVSEEEVPEPEAGDHRGDDLPPSPPRRMREAEDRGARDEERPRRDQRLARRIGSQGAAEEVPQAARDVAPRGSGPGPRAPAAHLEEPEDDGPERHRESDQRDAEGEFLVHARVREFEEEHPRVRRRDLDRRRRRDLGELEQQDERELEERHGHPDLRDREPRTAAPESSADRLQRGADRVPGELSVRVGVVAAGDEDGEDDEPVVR